MGNEEILDATPHDFESARCVELHLKEGTVIDSIILEERDSIALAKHFGHYKELDNE